MWGIKRVGDNFATPLAEVGLESLLPGLDATTRLAYKSSWAEWGRFFYVRGISVWLSPGEPGWGEPLLDFLSWPRRVLGRRAPTLEGGFATTRFMRLVNGIIDFSL